MVKHNGRCPQSPTGAHWWVMSWPEPCVYIGTCKWCGMVKHEDANLGLGRDDARTRVCGRYAARQEMAEIETRGDTPEEETMGEIQIPEFKPGVQGNTAKGRFYGAHFDQIRSDLATLGKAETIRKWGMSEAWLYDHFKGLDPNLIRRKARTRPERVTAPVSTGAAVRAAEELLGMPAGSVTAQTVAVTTNAEGDNYTAHDIPDDGDGKFAHLPVATGPLPAWNDSWTPEVQIAWLEAATAIELARTLARKVTA